MKSLQVKYFQHIPAISNRGLILARLGYRKEVTQLCGEYRKQVDETIREALLLCHLRGAFWCGGIIDRNEGQVTLENGVAFTSKKLALFLKDCSGVVLMAATAGREIYDKITELMREGDGSASVIYDAAASQVTDAALDWMMDFINKSISIRGEKLTKRRFSPGYGDLTLNNQKIIYEKLDLKKIDIIITDSFMLLPEKSVIAIAGIGAVTHE